MDLTIPHTFYPVALPQWISWLLFLLAMIGAVTVGIVQGLRRGWLRGAGAAAIGAIVLLFATMVASMVITFFVHDL